MHSRSLVESLLAVAGVWLAVRTMPDFLTSLALTVFATSPVSAAGPGALVAPALYFALSLEAVSKLFVIATGSQIA